MRLSSKACRMMDQGLALMPSQLGLFAGTELLMASTETEPQR